MTAFNQVSVCLAFMFFNVALVQHLYIVQVSKCDKPRPYLYGVWQTVYNDTKFESSQTNTY